MRRRIVIDHLARVEGHGGVSVVLDRDVIREVRFDIFEGARLIEGLVRGRRFEDISLIVSRICAICSAAHSITSLQATEDAFGVEISPQTELLRELLYRGGNIASHSLHLFLLALPDYFDCPSAAALATGHPNAVNLGLRLKRLGNSIQEAVGGRAIHPVNLAIGGFNCLPTLDQLIRLRQHLTESLADVQQLINLVESLPNKLCCNGKTSFSALAFPDQYTYHRGTHIVVARNGSRSEVPTRDYLSLTQERTVRHSFARHSLFEGEPFMVGALARVNINSHLLTGLAAQALRKLDLSLPSDNPFDNNKAQAVELAWDIQRSLQIVEGLLDSGLLDDRPEPVRPRAAVGTAVTEAPRGLLVHSYTYDDEGRVLAADMITPTAMNAASIENHMRRLVALARTKTTSSLKKKLEVLVRAYDPCISCAVHFIRLRPGG